MSDEPREDDRDARIERAVNLLRAMPGTACPPGRRTAARTKAVASGGCAL